MFFRKQAGRCGLTVCISTRCYLLWNHEPCLGLVSGFGVICHAVNQPGLTMTHKFFGGRKTDYHTRWSQANICGKRINHQAVNFSGGYNYANCSGYLCACTSFLLTVAIQYIMTKRPDRRSRRISLPLTFRLSKSTTGKGGVDSVSRHSRDLTRCHWKEHGAVFSIAKLCPSAFLVRASEGNWGLGWGRRDGGGGGGGEKKMEGGRTNTWSLSHVI